MNFTSNYGNSFRCLILKFSELVILIPNNYVLQSAQSHADSTVKHARGCIARRIALLYARYLCSRDALGLKARPSARARDDRVSCIQIALQLGL